MCTLNFFCGQSKIKVRDWIIKSHGATSPACPCPNCRIDLVAIYLQFTFKELPPGRMVGTRRTSKFPSNTEDEGGPSTTEDSHNSSFTVPIPEDFDIEAFTSLIPDFDIHSPSPESLVNLYQLLLEQSGAIDAAQRDVDELRAESERKDVELDQALQDREQSSKDMEQQVERLQEELTQVKQERDHLCVLNLPFLYVNWLMHSFIVPVASQNELQTRITGLASSQTSSSREAEELKHRLEDAEREKRDLINVISRLKQDGSERDGELGFLPNTLHITLIVH